MLRGPAMPRYYIDTDDGILSIRDVEEREFANIVAARDLAQRALREMAERRVPDGERRVFTSSIRDGNGTILYVATLILAAEWKIAPHAA